MQSPARPLPTLPLSALSDSGPEALRPEAETRLARSAPALANQEPHANLLHELQVRQLELEIQNEALQQGNDALEHAKADIEEGLKRYAALYELAPLAYFTLSPEGLVLKTNRLGQARLGPVSSKAGPQQLAALVDDSSLPAFHAFLQQLFEEPGTEPRRVCDLHLRASGFASKTAVELTGMACAGQASCNIAMVDMTERSQTRQEIERLNQALEMRVDQLGAANEDLEAFSSAVAHDLQSPLTALDGFRFLLERALNNGDQAAAKHCAQRIATLVAQMGQTTSGLLSLAHAARGPLQWADCDLTRMCAEILQPLRERDPARQVEVDLQPGLQARGDPALLHQLLANLLGNAWKFTSAQPMARIRLASENHEVHPGGLRCFMLEDNGAGFEMAQAVRLFDVFERLHSASEFPGDGIGLATVKRIIKRHGGSISATGEPGKGACFSFCLPTPAKPG